MSMQDWATIVGAGFATVLVACIAAILIAATVVSIRKMFGDKDE